MKISKIYTNQNLLLAALFFVLFLIQLFLLWKNEIVFGGVDNITHFQIARYSFKHPQLLLDLWGKPVFTTLLAPFTLLGFKAAQLFNVLVAVATLIFTFKISKTLYPKSSLLVVVLAAFAPVYFILMLTTLTEILFSFVLVLSVYLFLKNKFIFSALVISFIPFVRSEGIIFLPVFLVALSLKRSFISVPFLAFGTLFYSLIGYFVFGDFFWLINRFPYPTGESVYGSGSLFHFVKNSNFIFGIPLIILSVTGLIFWLKQILEKFSLKSNSLPVFILIAGCWLGYFAAHSFVWWKGMGGSLGLTRVMGGIVPLVALTAAKGVQFIAEKIKNTYIINIILGFFAVAQVYLLFAQTRLPLKAEPIDNLIEKSAEFIEEQNPAGKIFYFNPEFVYHLGLDPYDPDKSAWGIGDKLQPSNSIHFGDIIIWDAHFGPNEGRVNLETLKNDPYLQEMKTFVPLEKITVLGGYDYSIHIFKKVKQKAGEPVSDTYKKKLDFNLIHSQEIMSVDGSKVLELKNHQEFSPSLVIYPDNLVKKDSIEIEFTAIFKSEKIIDNKEVLLVLSVENENENLNYKVEPITWNENDSGWKTTTLNARIPADLPETATIKMYIWNMKHKHLYVKNMEAMAKSY